MSLRCAPIAIRSPISHVRSVTELRVKKDDQLKADTVQSVSILEMRHAVKKGYQAQTNEQMMEQFSSILTIITSVFGALAGIALLVGGIGIMNIILVSIPC